MKKILFIPILLFSLTSLGQTPLHFLIAKKASGGFTPSDVAGLRLWVAADEITGLSDNDPVATWGDLSGNSNDLTQATGAARPTYKTNIKNGLPVVRNASGDFLEKASPAGISNNAGMTIFLVIKNANDQDETFISKWDYQTQGSFAWQSLTGAAPNMRAFIASSITDDGSNNESTDGGTLLNITWYIFELVYDGSQASADRVKFYKNGDLLSSATSGTIPATLTSCTATLKIGKFGGALDRFFTQDYGEILVYDNTVADGDRTLIRTYLNDKWAIY